MEKTIRYLKLRNELFMRQLVGMNLIQCNLTVGERLFWHSALLVARFYHAKFV